MPSKEFCNRFIKRHKSELAVRLCQNNKRAKAGVSPDAINDYFNNLEESLQNIPLTLQIIYLSNDPDRSKIIAKRGCKYPKRVMHQTKSAMSKMLPCCIVYKAKNVNSI